MHTTFSHYILRTCILGILWTLAFTISAQEMPVVNPQEEIFQATTSTETKQEARTERRQTFEVRAQDRILNLISNIENRLIATHDRMLNIVGRLESRIEKLKALGIDTNSAETKLREAKSILEEARIGLSNMSSFEFAIRSDAPSESFSVVRKELMSAHEKIRTAHTLLRGTISILKEELRSENTSNSASSTFSQSATTTQ